MTGWTLDATQVKTLSIEEVGAHILREVERQGGRTGFTNLESWTDELARSFRNDEAAQRAIVEAAQWLRIKGLVMRHPSQSSDSFVYVTRRGEQVLDEGLQRHKIVERLDVDLVAELQPAKELYLQGRFDTAAFEAMKAVEVRVRALAGFGNDLLGVSLMRKAFGANGPLADETAEPGERDAVSNLFAGAIGTFKNPSSHREVNYDDATEAAEVILLADLLMRLLRRRA